MIGFNFMVTMAIWVLLIGITAAIIASIVATLICGSLLYSRLAFSLLGALVVHNKDIYLIQSGGFMNFLAWTAVIFAVLWLLSLLPRVGGAIRAFCTMTTAFLVIYGVVMLVSGILTTLLKNDFAITAVHEIIMKGVVAFFAFGATIPNEEELAINFENPVLVTLERLVASLIHGVTILFMFLPMNGNWELSGFATLVVYVLGVLVSFGFGVFAEKNDLYSDL